jgi:hypothetical protein
MKKTVSQAVIFLIVLPFYNITCESSWPWPIFHRKRADRIEPGPANLLSQQTAKNADARACLRPGGVNELAGSRNKVRGW